MKEYTMDIVRVSPPITVSAFTLFGFPLQNWVLILTAIYTLLQIYVLMRDKIIFRKTAAIDEESCNAK